MNFVLKMMDFVSPVAFVRLEFEPFRHVFGDIAVRLDLTCIEMNGKHM